MPLGANPERTAWCRTTQITLVHVVLQRAKEDGAEFVVMSSGNYRGAQWASVGTDYDWAGEE